DEGAQNRTRLASLVATFKLNGIEPIVYMKTTREALVAGHRDANLDQLLPWSFQTPATRGCGPSNRCRRPSAKTAPKTLQQTLQSLLQLIFPSASEVIGAVN